MNAIDNPLSQVAPETCGVCLRQTDVFVKMKEFNSLPIDVVQDERVEELKLRRASRGNDISNVAALYRLLNNCRRVARRSFTQPQLTLENLDVHCWIDSHLRDVADRSTASSTR